MSPWLNSVAMIGTTAFVTNEGGRPAQAGDTTNDSDGTAIVSDPYHGSAADYALAFDLVQAAARGLAAQLAAFLGDDRGREDSGRAGGR